MAQINGKVMLKESYKYKLVDWTYAEFVSRLQPVADLMFCILVCGTVRQEPLKPMKD